MTEADLSTALTWILSTSGAVPLVLWALKHFTKDYLATKEKAIALEKAIAERTIKNLEEAQVEIKGTVKALSGEASAMKDHMLLHRMAITDLTATMSKHSTQLEQTLRAFQAYTEKAHTRMSAMETELFQLSKDATLVRQKKG